MKKVAPIAVLAVTALAALVACPAAEVDPGQGVRDLIEQEHAFVREGEYDKVWTLYAVEFREKIEADFAEQKKGIRKMLALNAYDVDEWAVKQTGMTAEQYLAATPRQILAATLKVRREDALKTRIVGEVHVEGDYATARIAMPPGGEPAEFRFVFRDGRWLYLERSFMPSK